MPEAVRFLISPEELASSLRSPASGLQVIDTRPAEDFAGGRIPGALHLDLWAFSLNDTDPAPLRSFLWMIAHVLAARGIDPARPAVVYDDVSGIRAARVFWFLEYFGHPNVRLLDGGFGAWERRGMPIETGRVKTSQSKTPGEWPERVPGHPERLATWKDVNDRLGKKDAVILDTRSDAEYYADVARARRGGSVPGAVHVEWTRNLTPESTFKPTDELRDMYERAGVTPDRDVVTYCQGGYRAAHSYLALRLLGYPRVRAYLGSWKEWGDREDLPIEVPKRSHG